MTDAGWIIITGGLVATLCGVLGCFVILRKMAMVGDAISHAVLPGIVIAYMLSGDRASVPMLIGASVLGVVVTLMIEYLHRKGNLQTDASIGLSFTFLFSVGIVLVTQFADQVDIDADCVLHGEIAMIPFDHLYLGGEKAGPVAVWILGGAIVLISLGLIAGYKGLYLTTFNPEYATALGVSTAFWHYALMSSVSLSTVVSFESVGAILVVAFLVVPAATAYLLSSTLKGMILTTVLLGWLSSYSGYYLASWLNSSVAGSMSFMAGVIFLIAFLFAPDRGYLAKKWGRRVIMPHRKPGY